MVNFFRTDPTLRTQFDEVSRWVDWRYNGGKADTGIDLVARRVDDGTWMAIQCKFYASNARIQKSHLDSFFEASGHSFETENGSEYFGSRMIISTTDYWSSHAEAALANQMIPTSRIGISTIAESPINWDVAFPGSEVRDKSIQINLSQRETFEPRPHQQTAIDKAIEGFKTHDRGKLIMACGTGKTFTALRLAERVAENNGGKARILFLVPSISLLSQTLKEWTAQGRLDMRAFAVCSDSKVSKKAEDIAVYDLEVPVSTDGEEITQRFASGKRAKGLNIVFSTYQSLPAVHEAQQQGLDDFDLVICDEAHRTTGITLAGEDASNFVRIHDAGYIRAAKRLYMTATPRLYDDAVKGKAAEHSAELTSMDDEGIYGPEFYRLGFGEAVDKGLLTDYKVLVMTVDESVAAEAMARSDDNQINLTTASAMIGAWNGLAKRSGELQGKKGGFEENAQPMQRAVAFAKDIKSSQLIADTYPSLIATHQELLKDKAVLNDVSLTNVDLRVAAQHVDGGMNAMERGTKLSWIESPASENESRMLTNARCLSEGVDVPALDAVVFFRQKNAPINVVIGNPPYSAGQKSANDLNANQKYPSLDKRIAETYAEKSTATNKNSLYDSYLRAFRWATDRIGDQGVVAFVSNGGWIDGNTGDGVRLSMAEDFTNLYIFNLRGNARTAGEQRRKEAGNVFRDGGRTSIAVMVGVKDPTKLGFELHYRDIGDYLTAEEKLDIVDSSSIETIDWQSITPNKEGDWLNQRSEEFEKWPVIGEKKGKSVKIFQTFSAGLKTGRDIWAYAHTGGRLLSNLGILAGTYAEATAALHKWLNEPGISKPRERDVNAFLQAHPRFADTTKISWNRALKNLAAKDTEIPLRRNRVYRSLYRPFMKQRVYFEQALNDMTYQLPSMFPTREHVNIGFLTVGAGESLGSSVLATDLLPDLHVIATSQFFTRFTWSPLEADDGGLFGEGDVVKQGEVSIYGKVGEVVDGYVRVDNITDEIKALYREALGADVTGDDIFHFVYGKLHDPGYRTKYAADLKKMLPHIETPSSRAEFDKFAAAGKELMDLHVNYESVEPWPLDIQVKGDESDRETWRVLKMKWAKRKDPETGKNVNDVTKLIYNKRVTIAGIPAEADEYMLGSRSAVAWLIDRYQVKKDKASGIVNDPNDWADEVGNPRYIVDLIGKVTRVAMETVRIVDGLVEEGSAAES